MKRHQNDKIGVGYVVVSHCCDVIVLCTALCARMKNHRVTIDQFAPALMKDSFAMGDCRGNVHSTKI